MGIKRNKALDFLRGLAVSLVLINHVFTPQDYYGYLKISKYTFGESLLSFIHRGGWTGVDLFFVLSGFLISGLLFSEYSKYANIKPGLFLIRRGFKIYPSFYFFLIVGFIFQYVTRAISISHSIGAYQFSKTDYIYNSLFVMNYYLTINQDVSFGHLWSIDVEEHFYLILVFLLSYLIKINKLNFVFIKYICISLFIFCFFTRLYENISIGHFRFGSQYVQTHLRIDGLFFGVFLGYCNTFRKDIITSIQKKKILVFLISIPLLLLNFIFNKESNQWISVCMLGINPIAYGLILVAILDSKNVLFNSSNVISKIGVNSYSIYLWHVLTNLLAYKVILQIAKRHFVPYYIYFFSYLILSLLVGVIFTKIIELPFLKIRDRYYPSRGRVIV